MSKESAVTDRLVAKLMEACDFDFERYIRVTAKDIEPFCESPIELLLATTMKVLVSLQKTPVFELFHYKAGDCNAPFYFITQFEWRNYRIDFAAFARGHRKPIAFIECDGHDFHERTKEQAERDRKRDRSIQMGNIPVLRFTGREIWRDPSGVLIEILNFVAKMHYGKNSRD